MTEVCELLGNDDCDDAPGAVRRTLYELTTLRAERDALDDLLKRAGDALRVAMSEIENAEYDDYTMQVLNAIVAEIETRKGGGR